ncbi:MAG: hypothetical protein QNK37_06285 [Acidobacteriota bacterium]|nr:hypothetical protein [Acidobacteriota bacterium]
MLVFAGVIWNLFSGIPEKVHFGEEHFHWKRNDHSTITRELYTYYREEDIDMAYTIEDLKRDSALEGLPFLSPEERIKGLDPAQIMQSLDPEQRKLLGELFKKAWTKEK